MRSPSDATAAVDFRILGPLDVHGSDLAIQPQAKVLLGILVLNANQFLSTGDLVDRVWGSKPPASAVNSIHKYIGSLRDVLGASGTSAQIETKGTAYALQLRSARVDLTLFREFVELGRSALAGGDPETAAEAFHAATGLWGGTSAFSDLDGYDEIDQVRRALADELAEARELRFEAELATRDPETIARELQPLCEVDPLNSNLAGLLMRAWHLAARPDKVDEALEAFKGAWERFYPAGTALPRKLVDLYNRILDGDPSLSPPKRLRWQLAASVDEACARLSKLSDHAAHVAHGPMATTFESLGLTSQGRLTEFGSAYAATLRSIGEGEQQEILARFLPRIRLVDEFLAHLATAETLTREEAESVLRGIAEWPNDVVDRSPSLWLQWMLRAGLVSWKYNGKSRPLLVRGVTEQSLTT